MITEDYVTFEVAKLLKEKGFDEACPTAYSLVGKTHKVEQRSISDWGKMGQVKRPTLQMVMKWLREVYNIFIAINIIPNTVVTMEQRYYFFKPYKNRRIHNFPLDYSIQCYETYEEACEAGIRYCLKN